MLTPEQIARIPDNERTPEERLALMQHHMQLLRAELAANEKRRMSHED